MPNGYGQVWDGASVVIVHRLAAFICLGGFDMKDRSVDVMHKCDNRKCFEPLHLVIGTRKQNMEDAQKKGRLKRTPKKFCKSGHLLEGNNLYLFQGRRRCRTCRNLTAILYHEAVKKHGF